MPNKVIDMATRATDYRLNQLGIRVSKNVCQLISRVGEKWMPMGPVWQLPISVPKEPGDLAYAHALSITAYQFCRACPDSDLLDVLTQDPSQPTRRSFNDNPARFDLLEKTMSSLSWREKLVGCEGDHIATSRALICSSRELLSHRKKEDA